MAKLTKQEAYNKLLKYFCRDCPIWQDADLNEALEEYLKDESEDK